MPGRRCHLLPACDVPVGAVKDLLPAGTLAAEPPPLPELAELDLVRHFVNLSTLNMSVDTQFLSAGLVYDEVQPQAERAAGRPAGPGRPAPLSDRSTRARACSQLLYELQDILAEIAGLPAVSLQPAAGAQGELTALLVAAAYFRDRGEKRTHGARSPTAPTAPTRQRRHGRLRRRDHQEQRPTGWSTSTTSRPSSTTARPCS